ncbi:MAG: YwaF family protein [Clostridia bacterium]|nr:YwaF family protein [Clostridia bacterium]
MRELFFYLFKKSHFETGIKITPFSVAHIVYLVLIIGGIIAAYCYFRNKSEEQKARVLRVLMTALVISYVTDFFIHPFVYGEYIPGASVNGDLQIDKLPFHLCTVLCPIGALVQFNKHFKKFAEPVALLAILGTTMYMSYPASVGSGEPWCYQALQTMFYHGVLLAWGVLQIAFGFVKPDIKHSWKAGCFLVGMTLWAKFGNLLYADYNWFFLEEDAFYIGLVGTYGMPKWMLMIINPIVFFSAVIALYGIIYIFQHHAEKKQKNAPVAEAPAAEAPAEEKEPVEV